MKKIVIFVIMLIGMGMFPSNVFAENDVLLSCSTEVMVGNQVECTVTLSNLTKKVLGMQTNIEFPSEFSFLGFDSVIGWEILSSSSTGFVITNLDGVDTDGQIATMKFLVSNKVDVGKNYSVGLKNVKLTDGEKDIVISDKNSEVHVLSILELIDSITINGKTLELKDGVTNYAVDVNGNLEIDAVLEKSDYTFLKEFAPRKIVDLKEGESTHYLKVGKNGQEIITFTIQVNNLGKIILEDDVDNPKTGGIYGVVIFILMLLSFGIFIFFGRKVQLRRNGV